MDLKLGKEFAELTDDDLRFFRGVVGEGSVKTDELDEYNVDFMSWYKGGKHWTGWRVHDEIVLSTKKITNTFLFDANSGVLDCDAEDADVRLAKDGFMVPIDLGAKGSCLIGGITATNAGGIRLIRYGSMHSHVLGMEVVVPDKHGTVLKLGSNLRKDNTDLHLHKLFVGSEGQLGVITRVQMLTVPKPTSVQCSFL
uniref:FAD-binding PCMH-type domain-containing protein n=1 Tax=Globodera pallida TaxID=36090 RepID=A0A183CIK1_GLOPA